MTTHFSSNDLRLGDYLTIGGFKMQGAAVEDFAGFNFGWADINGDGLSDLLVCSDGYDGGGLLAGGAFVIYGKADGITPFIDFANLSSDDGFVIQGEFASDLASRMLSSAGDVNGDGIDDMFIGAFKNDEGAHDSGAAYIIYGKSEGFGSVLDLYDLSPANGIKILGEGAEDYASFWVASAGDVNGDGHNDLIMGAPQNDGGGNNSGAAYVIFGRDSNFSGKISLATLDPSIGFKITGAAAGDQAGNGVSSAGDINGDGIADLLVGAPQDGTGNSGRAYVLYGSQNIGATDLAHLTAQQGFVINGEASGDLAGFNVSGAGDVNGDGISDIIIGATNQDSGGVNSGAAYVVFGKSGGFGTSVDLSTLDGTNGFKLQGAAAGDETGVCVSTAGDVNGDGYTDLLVGAQFSTITGTISGVAYLLFGKAGGSAPIVDLGNLSSSAGVRFRGESAGDTTGRAVSAAGDMNGDGYDDIAIGSPWNSVAGFKAGAAYVIYGRPDNRAPVAIDAHVNGIEDTRHTFSVSDFGFSDADGDTLSDVIIRSLPDRGSLMISNNLGLPDRALIAGESVSVASISAGQIYFLGSTNESGPSYATLSFDVRDDGGVVASGQDTSLTAATLTIALAAESSDADLIYGTIGDDTLVGNGSNAAIFGLAGDDTYIVSDAGQVAIEVIGEGFDTVRTSVDYTLSATSEIERLEAADPASTQPLRLGGNEFANYVRGNAGNNSLIGAGGSDTLEGLGGDDAYLVTTSADQVVELAGGGNDTVYALGDYTLTAGAQVETLLAYDRSLNVAQNLTGNEFANLILGTQGDNVIDGGAGRDTMFGYGGNDTYYVDDAGDLPEEFFGEGFDTIVTKVSYTIPQGMEFEVLRTIDPLATTVLNLTGNKIGNMIVGNAGANIIDGAGGGDVMQGLGGDDIYIVRNAKDQVIEVTGGGIDTVRTLIDLDISNTDVERLEAFDPASTNMLRLAGNALNNTIIGNAGTNALIGGVGEDILQGLGGNDAYIVEDSRTHAIEDVGGGYDTVYSTVDYTLEAGSEIETLSVYDRTTSNPLRLVGNDFSNSIYGNAGDNVLIGGGGADTLYGLGGNDTYVVDSANDVIIELGGAGIDTVFTQTSYALLAEAEIEKFAALDATSAIGLRLTGNSFDQRIEGTAGVDSIIGGGGADTLVGLGGDDAYLVSDSGTHIVEGVGGGQDTVYTSVNFSLDSGSEIEVLTVYERSTTNALNLTGNEFDNIIYGNAGANRIGGGHGSDTLYGLGGSDTFVFASALGPNNVDRLMDFQSGADHIELDHTIFGGIAAGTLGNSAFVLGTHAQDADDRLIYDADSGALWYDADGLGGVDAIRFAQFDAHTILAGNDFVVI